MRWTLPKSRERLRREAASWLARLQSGRETDVEWRFRSWYDADPSHAQAFERVRKTYDQAGLLRRSVSAATEGRETWERSRTVQPSHALAAALALCALLAAGLHFVQRGFGTAATDAVMLSTAVGEIKRVTLADGSQIILDTSTSLEVRMGRARRALLRSGRARFEVAPGAVPFVIEAGKTTASTDKGVIEIEHFGEPSQFDILAGAANLRTDGSNEDLAAGESITADGRHLSARRLAVGRDDWTRGMLEFDATPLGSAVTLANRYSRQKIVLGSGLEQLRVTGAFHAGDTAGLARSLAEAFHLSLRQAPGGSFILSNKQSP